ncbi:MAG: Mth938-like domain-containing protein [Candidatus Methylopumilus sp.]|nr:Mth938-like domain-containing protein [Candidatus Methylopumilus sp.]
MKFHLIQSDNKNLITGYDLNWVEVNQVRHQSSLIVTPDQLLLEWSVKTIKDINENSFEAIKSLDIEIILLGTGNTQEHLEPKLLEYFSKKNIAIESMSNQSACRTYNILANEERKVLLALML